MYKKFIIFLIALLPIILIFDGCKQGKVKIGFLMDDFTAERWNRDRDLFLKYAEDMGAKVMLDSAKGNIKTQFEQAKAMLEKGVDVLVVVPANSEQASAIVKLSHRYEVPVISYDRLIKNCDLDYYISFENAEVGELMAEYVSKRCPVGNYAIICGPPSDNNSFFIKYGQMSVIQPLIEKGDIKVIYDGCVDEWSMEQGYANMIACIESGEKVDVVMCANDELARGAIKALKEHHLEGEVLVTGQDAEAEAIRNIIAGYQTMTVYKPIEAIANAAVRAAILIGRDEPVLAANQSINNGQRMVPAILLNPMVVNRDNINMTVMAEGYLKEHQLNE